MRYEDASHTGEFQGQGPIANDDLELVAAGQKSSATGNLITGEGTQSGTAGADSAAGAHITSIAGKGGEDSSFAGGKLSVMGDYGKLSVDADGNYIYQVNKGVENVRDRFTYTLADSEGASDSAALIVEIGKTPLVIQANAQQIVPGPDGVVTLPPGVELSDVHVVGRNLVIDMPDGTQLIIVDGAVFVPQLVLGGVEVPATNVAALLVGQEIQPAAGETPPSSGGNFAVPPPPLDPGVPLGDLIPPTEYTYIPPEPQPTFAIEDDEPEAGVANVILDDDVVVEEGNRPDGPGDEGPDVLGQNVASGNLPGSEGDGALTWGLLASGVLPAGFSFAAQLNGDIWIMQGADHVLTVHVTPATGAFTVTQVLPLDHPAGGDENNLNFTINYSVTDEDGDTAIGQLNVNVDDDTPTVNVQAGPDANVILTTDDADTDGTPTDSDTDSTTANFSGVFSGTTVSFGADGAGPGTSSTYTLAVTGQNSGLTSHGATINLFVVGGVVVGTTAGSAGAINAGNTIFTVSTTNTGVVTLTQFQQIDHPIAQDPTATTAPFNDQFISMVDGLVTLTRSETVVDGDGDQVTGSATVNIGANLRFTDDGPSIGRADVSEPTLNVDETTFGTNDTESFAANFTATFGADGPGGITYTLGVLSANAASGLIDTLTGNAVVLNLVNGQVVGTAGIGGPVVFTVSVDANGNVTLDQSRAVIHDPDSGPDQTTTLSADNLVTLTATATDFDGDTDSETINIGLNLTFDDDAPTTTANTLSGTVDEDGVPGGIAGGPQDVAGESASTSGNVSSLFNSGADQPLTFGFASNTIAVLEALGLTSGGDALDYEIVGNTVTASTAAGDVFTFTLNPNGSYTFTLLDQLDHPTLNGQVGDDTENDLSFNLGAIIEATDADGDSVVAPAGGLVITVDDDTPVARNDEDTVPAGGDIITGNVITGANTDTGVAGADSPGADAPAQIIGLASNNVPANVDNNPAGGFVVVGEFGTLTMQADGSYSYDRNPGSPGNVEDVFTYTYEDFDGDKVTATLTININDSAPTLPDPDLIRLDDDVIPGANGNNDGPADDDPDAPDDNVVSGQLNGSGGDGDLDYAFTGVNTLPTGFSIGAGSDADTLLIVQDQGGSDVTVMTIQLNLETGAFTVTQNNPIWHPTQNGTGNDDTENNLDFSIGVQVTDADNDSDPATITINVDDDTPTINVTKGSDAAVILTTDDAQTIGGASDTAVSTANFSGVFGLTQSAGADGTNAAATLQFTLDVTGYTGGPAGVDSGLDQGGVSIFLYEIGGKVVGSTSATLAGVNAGNTVFDVAVSGTGVVTLTQYSQIDHPIGSDPTATGSPFADHIVSMADGLITLTASASLTDKDGDTVTDSEVVNIGANLQFTDDGPSAAIAETGQSVSLDESVGIQVDSNDTTAPAVIALFAGVTNTGTDTHLPQYAQNATAVVNSTGSAYGADGAGTTVFSLNVSAAGVDSGLNTTDGHDILLFKEGNLIVGRVSGGADDGKAALAIAIDPVTGVISTVEYLSIQHPNAANPDDSVSIVDGAVLAVVTVTDFDGDTATQQVGIGSAIQFQDSGPVMTAAQNMNIQNSGDVAHTAAFAFNLGADGPNITTNDVITNVTGSATVAGVAVTNYAISQTSEDANTAVFTFSFDYPIGGGATAHTTGTLTFNKLAGTYTIDLANPIQGVTTILQTATGTLFQGYEFGTSNLDGSQPEISVTQIQDLAGTANDIYVQFTSVSEPSSGTGNDALEVTNWVPGADNPPPIDAPPNPDASDFSWSAGQIFNQEDSWVSTSNDANGVAGDTIQGGEVLDFTLVKGANPTGVLASPADYAQASAMFLKFDGIGEGEDMIVILKLFDTNTLTYTTKALMIQNGDIQKGPGTGPGIFSGITLDNNDGLIIIEPNDYQQGNTNLVIVGAQVAGSDEGVTGTAIDFSYGGVLGGASTGTQAFSTDVNDGPMKISSIGFVSIQTTPQNAELTFNVTVTDGDGDSITQTVTATVTSAVDSVSAATIPAGNTTVAPVVLDLNGDGVQFLGTDAGVRYDYDGDGVKEATAWAGASDGILVRDANGDGTVTDASEFVFGHDGLTDLQALAAQYGAALDAGDVDFSKFGVWQDANSNGAVDAGEFVSLTAAGITSISLTSDGASYSAAGGDVEVAGSSTYTSADGSTGLVADASFHVGRMADDGRELNSTSSTIAIAAAVAAAGLAANQAAAAPLPDEASHGQDVSEVAASVGPAVQALADDASEEGGSALGGDAQEAADDVAPVASSGHSDAAPESGHSLDDSNAAAAAGSDHAPANDQGPTADAAAAGPVAPAVAMVSAEALLAAGLDGNAQHTGAVDKVIAEALGQGNGHGAIDALLDAFQGGNGGGAAIANLASSNANAVSAWDMASDMGSNMAHEMLMKVGAQIHHDMVPPTQNG